MVLALAPLFASAAHDPAILPMVVLGAIMIGTYVLIAFEWLHKSLAAMFGAFLATVAALIFGLFKAVDGDPAYEAVHRIVGHELGVIGVLVGTSILVDVAARSGLFHFIAVKIVKRTQGDPYTLLRYTAVLAVLFVTFLTIAPGTLIVVSLVLVVTKALDLDATPYVLVAATCANSGALMTLASGICTLMLAQAGGLTYISFFRVTTPIAILTAVIAYLVVARLYRARLVAPGSPEERAAAVARFDEWALVKDRRVFFRVTAILVATILGFALARTIGIGLDFVALAGGMAALLFSGQDPDEAVKQVKWPVILFFVGLFVIIGAVEETHLLDKLATSMLGISGGSATVTMLVVAVFVLVLSGLLDNIPVAATLIPIVRTLGNQGLEVAPLWWSLIVAANLGGNSTPVGSISTVIALAALEKERGIKVGWGEFLRVGGLIVLIQGVLALGYLYLFDQFGLFPRK